MQQSTMYLFVSKTYFGLFMNKNFGKNSMKKDLIHGFMVWVCGDRKWTLSTTTVTHILWTGRKMKNRKKIGIFSLTNFRPANSPYRDQYHSEYEIFAKQGHDQTVVRDDVCMVLFFFPTSWGKNTSVQECSPCRLYMVYFPAAKQFPTAANKRVNGASEDRDKLTEREFCLRAREARAQ